MYRIFVYGSLKQNHFNHRILSQFLKEALTGEYFKMVGYTYETFPYVMRASALIDVPVAPNQGELYEVGDECLEGHPSFYTQYQIYVEQELLYIYLIKNIYSLTQIQERLGRFLETIPSGVRNSDN